MDRSFSSPLAGRSTFSPRVRPGFSSKKVLPQSFRKSSISGKSSQSIQIILSSPYNFVERYGQPLPVLITEALTFADKNTVVSARISKHGYAWIVCGRRLLIWQYRQSPSLFGTPQRRSGLINQCFELLLPQSDLAHRAELVSILIDSKSNIPSCIAVSPEGVVRYWPAIVHEGVSIEQSIDLQGQECDSLTDVEGLGCILATTTCTIVLIQPQLSGGRHNLKCKPLKVPTGWLGGIGKRMSSLIFGPISNEHSSEIRLVRVLSVPNDDDSWTVYILAGHSLQKWRLSAQEPEEFIFVTELNRLVRDSFRTTLWENCGGDQTEIDTWLLDLQADKENIIILTVAVNLQVSPRIHYGMICLQTNIHQPPPQAKDFLLLKMTDLYREESALDFLSYRFLLCGTYAYLYNQRSVTVIKPHEDPDTLEFNSAHDFLLAGSICVNTPLFFTKNNGLVAISSNELSTDLNLSVTCPNTPADTSFSDNIVVNNLSIYNMDPDEMTNAYKDTLNQLKAAFIYHIKKQESAYMEILQEIFPIEGSILPGIDSLLDKVVIMVCTDLLDDIPAGDPRWSSEIPLGIGSSYTMQVLHQLEDKQKAYALFLQFLKESGLWNRLAVSTIRGSSMPTIYYLGELSEKIVAAIALKCIPSNQVLDKVIECTVKELDIVVENGLTYQDLFYKNISKIHVGIQQMVNHCEDVAHSDLNPLQVVEIIRDSNQIILSVLSEVLKHRQQYAEVISERVLTVASEYLPWTSANGSEGLLDCLFQLHYLTYNDGIILTDNDNQKNFLLDHFVNLIDIILDGRKCYIESIKGSPREEIIYKQYCIDRKKLMKPLLLLKEWERAAQLAEKYLDFETLVIVCETSNNQKRLDEYIERFNNDGFSDFVYNWFLKENKQGKLIDRCRTGGNVKNVQKLTKFLNDHPSLSWMQNIFDKKFDAAANTLKKMAMYETESITRQKTMYSLSKLSKLVTLGNCENSSDINEINSRLELIAFQEQLPDYLLQQFGYDIAYLKVIPPKDLIHLYTCKEYKDATELDFKKALDLLVFIDDNELKLDLSLKIWRNAILRDTWYHANLDSPLDILQSKLFFRLIDITTILDGDTFNILPPLDVLMDDNSLKDLQHDKNFQFLIKTGYEHVYRTQTLE